MRKNCRCIIHIEKGWTHCPICGTKLGVELYPEKEIYNEPFKAEEDGNTIINPKVTSKRYKE